MQCLEWNACFKVGRTFVKDNTWAGRPLMSAIFEAVEETGKEDSRRTIYNTADLLMCHMGQFRHSRPLNWTWDMLLQSLFSTCWLWSRRNTKCKLVKTSASVLQMSWQPTMWRMITKASAGSMGEAQTQSSSCPSTRACSIKLNQKHTRHLFRHLQHDLKIHSP